MNSSSWVRSSEPDHRRAGNRHQFYDSNGQPAAPRGSVQQFD